MKRYILLVFAAVSFTHCSDVLDKEPLANVNPSTFFRNADDAESALTSAYDALQPDTYYGWPMNSIGELPSDNAQTSNGDVMPLDNINWNSSTGVVTNVFRQAYIGINRANALIKYVATIEMPEERRDQIVGQGHFLRALHYFNLVRLYGGLPLRLAPIESGENSVVAVARSSEDEVYAQIIDDLQQAEILCGDNYGSAEANRAYATKTAASALLTKVYLTRRQWDNALATATKVLANGNYSFTPDFALLFPIENQQESILEVQYTGTADDGGNAMPDLMLPSPPASYSFPKFNIPTAEIAAYANIAATPDKRWKLASRSYVTIPDGSDANTFPDTTMVIDDHITIRDQYEFKSAPGSGSGNDLGYFEFKHRGEPNFFNSPINYVIIRLSDVILMYAEASNEQNGPTGDALDKLNMTRVRAGLSPLTLVDVPSKQALRNAIDRERRLELAFEGERWFDLLRYAKHEAADGSADHSVTALDLIEQKRGTRNTNFLLFPIPLNEINNNPEIGDDQNPGF
jgi:hypothetical protein